MSRAIRQDLRYARRYPQGRRVSITREGGDRPRFAQNKQMGKTWIFFHRGEDVWRVEVLDESEMDTGAPEMFVSGVESFSWDVLPDGSGVIALEQRPEPRLRLVRGAAALFPPR